MAMYLNRATLLGRLGCDPETRHTHAGQKVVNFSLATSKRWRDKSDVQQERTTWHNIVAWGVLGDICEQVLRKGTMCYAEGELLTEQYTAKDGSQKTKTFIKADQVISLANGKDRAEAGMDPVVRAPNPVTVRDPAPAWDESEMPF